MYLDYNIYTFLVMCFLLTASLDSDSDMRTYVKASSTRAQQKKKHMRN